MRQVIQLGAVALLVMALVSCGSDGGDTGPVAPPSPSVGSVKVFPSTISELQIGDTTQLSAEVRDSDGNVLSGQSITWTTSNSSVATVSASGLVTAVAGGTATFTASVSGQSGQVSATILPWRIADNAVVVDSTILNLVSTNEELATGTLRFEVPAGQTAPTIEVGDVVVGVQSGGFLRRVQGMVTDGTQIVLTTTQAAMLDVVHAGSFDFTVDLSPPAGPSLEPGSGSPRITYMAPGVSLASDGFSLAFDFCTVLTCPPLFKVETEGTFKFEPSVNATAKISLHGFPPKPALDLFEATATGQLTTDLTVLVGIAQEFKDKGEHEIVKYEVPFTYLVGPFPVHLSLQATLVLGYELNASLNANIKAGGRNTSSITVGSRFENGSWSDVWDSPSFWQPLPTEWIAGGEASVKVYIRPRIDAAFWKIAGPYIAVEPFLQGSASLTTGSCGLSLEAGTDANLGFQVTAFDTTFADYNQPFQIAKKNIAQINCLPGGIKVKVETTGEAIDADGYQLVVDGQVNRILSVNSEVRLVSIPDGAHSVGLAGVANNCSIQGENPRSVTVQGAEAEVSIQVQCTDQVGSIRVHVQSDEDEPGPFLLGLNTQPSLSIVPGGPVTIEQVGVGDHTLTLSDVPETCQVEGENPKSITVAKDLVTEVEFILQCGGLTITVETHGPEAYLDPDGYELMVDGGEAVSIGIDSETEAEGLIVGTHTVELRGLAEKCSVEGDNPREADSPGHLTFIVYCGEELEITVVTTGEEADWFPPASVGLFLKGTTQIQWVGPNETVTFRGLAGGVYELELEREHLPAHCSIDDFKLDLMVPGQHTFEVYCGPSERVYFFRQELGSPTRSIFVMNEDGTGVTEMIRDDDLPSTNFSFSSSFSVDPLGGNVTFVAEPAPSPGGGWRSSELWVANNNGTSPRRLLEPAPIWPLGDDAFSPDGQLIAVTMEVDGVNPLTDEPVSIYALFTVNFDSGETTMVPDTWGNCRGPASWSPDGSQIAVQCWSTNPLDPWEEGCPACTDSPPITLVPLDGSGLRQLTSGEDGEVGADDPTWSPEGDQIAFRMDGGIHRVDLQTGQILGVTTEAGLGGAQPSWSPNTGRIAFAWNGKIYTIDQSGENVVPLTEAAGFIDSMPKTVR